MYTRIIPQVEFGNFFGPFSASPIPMIVIEFDYTNFFYFVQSAAAYELVGGVRNWENGLFQPRNSASMMMI